MPGILLRRGQRLGLPSSTASIAPAYRQGLVSLVAGNNYDVIAAATPAITGTITTAPTAAGLAQVSSGADTNYVAAVTPNSNQYTIVAVCVLLSRAAAFNFILDGDDGNDVRNFQLRISATGVDFIVFNTVASAFTFTISPTITLGKPFTVVARQLGAAAQMWIDGLTATPVAITGTPQTWGPKASGRVDTWFARATNHTGGSTFGFNGSLALRGVWKVGLPADRCLALSRNPGAMFTPLPGRLYFDVPAGVAISESASAADTTAASVTTAAAVSESGAAADTVASAWTTAAAVTESGSAADTTDAGKVTAAAIAETGTAVDAVSVVAPNLLVCTDTLNDTSWTASDVTVATDGTAGPFGDANEAWRLTEGSGGGPHKDEQLVTLAQPSTNYTASVYAKAGSGSRSVAIVMTKRTGFSTAAFDVSAGTVLVATASTATITSIGGGWWRCSILFDSGGGSAQPKFSLQVGDATGNGFYTGDSSSGVYVARPKLELGALSAYVLVPCPTASAIAEAGSAADTTASTATFAGAITEAGSAADTTAAAKVTAGAISEAGAAADTTTAGTTTSAAVAESGSAADTTAAGTSTAAAISEAGSALDTVAAGTATSATSAEAGSATDSVGSAWSTSAAIAEAGSAADTVAAGKVTAAAVAESGSAADTVDASISSGAANAIAESGAAVDTVAAAQIAQGAIVEAGTAADTTAAAATLQGAIAEAGAGVSTQNATVVGASAVAESAAATDTTAASATFVAAQQEVGSAVDTPAASIVTFAAVSEAGAAVDTTSAALTSGTASDVAEAGNAIDSCDAHVVYAGSIAEGTASAADVTAAAALWAAAIAETGAASDTAAAGSIKVGTITEAGAAVDTWVGLGALELTYVDARDVIRSRKGDELVASAAQIDATSRRSDEHIDATAQSETITSRAQTDITGG